MAARDAPVWVEPQPYQDVATEALHDGHAFALLGYACGIGAEPPDRQAGEDLLDQIDALLDLADADPHPRIDVAGLEHRHFETQLIVGRIGERAASVEGAAAGAAT